MMDGVGAEVRKLIRPLQADLKRLLQELVRTNSVASPPDGNETPAQQVLQVFFREHGVKSVLYDTAFIEKSGNALVRKNRRYRGRKNLHAHVSGTGRGKSLLLNGHMDTVPPGVSAWSRSPWSGQSGDGRIHGLGAFDMKGGVVANAAVLCALVRAGIRPSGDVLFESVVDEEWGGGGGTIAARLRSGSADACVISEGTQLEIYRATRGGFTVDLIVDAGDTSGYFSKSEVVSPAIAIGRLLGWVDRCAKRRARLKSTGAYKTFSDPVPVQVLAIEANGLGREIPLSVPSRATVRVYFQFLPEEDVDTVIDGIHADLVEFSKADKFFQKYPIQWVPLLGGPLYGHELALDHPLTRCMAESAGAVLQRKPVVTAAPYPCDAGLIHRDFGIPTLLFGPCGAGAHNVDEYVEFGSVLRTAEVLLAAALTWNG
ncbi:M20 family metallopeptidase [Acidicapsa ligni]|uniref:M20 family metallopeptidase n=1 Tax=Acidicapsa ligni TaxID=542300 RepID=UPI0021DF705F|nr:M20/M25/M40 family metallo-hydrolase [Acidicapsa ligni]